MAENQSKAQAHFPIFLFYLTAFIEGGAVMAIELTGAKMIAPFYGSSLYVWAAILTVTLGGLTSGYFLGGRAAYKFKGDNLLLYVLVAGTLFIALMPLLSVNMMLAFSSLELRIAALLSASGFMLLPLICMGMVSPILIQLSTQKLEETGKMAGSIYAISTVGGILMTMLMGFYFLPEWGIRLSVFFTAVLFGGLSLILLIYKRNFKLLAGLVVLLAAIFFIGRKTETPDKNASIEIQYQSEGMLGQLTVYDKTEVNGQKVRYLMCNGIQQTHVMVEHIPYSAWEYVHRLSTMAGLKPAGSKALLVGLAGGTLAMEMKGLGFDVDVVDIDARMPKIATDYFGFDGAGMNIFIDDGRHYIKNAKQKYDVVIIDVINGEVQPYHLFTKQAFADLKKSIADDALVLINFQGYLRGVHGLSARSLIKTLQESGFQVKYHNSTEKNVNDILISASPTEFDFYKIDPNHLNACCQMMAFTMDDIVTNTPLDLSDAIVFEDDKPELEIMNNYWIEEWRRRRIEIYALGWNAKHIPLF